MKIRNGFVSNSSSSSFIVSFPKEPKSLEDVKNMLFPNGEKTYFGYYAEDFWSIDQVAQTVWRDICDQKKNDYEAVLQELQHASSYDDSEAPDYDDYDHIVDWKERHRKLDEAYEKYAKKKIKEFFNTRKDKLKKLNGEKVDDKFVYIFEYSDNDGTYGSALEHGDLFKNIKHLKISKH